MISQGNPPGARQMSPTAGFTLIELIVVLAILGITLVLFTSYRPIGNAALSADGAAVQLAADLGTSRVAGDGRRGLRLDRASHFL